MGLPQSHPSKVDIDHRRLDVRVAEDALKAERITTVLDVVGGECVSEDVRSHANSVKPRLLC